MYSLLIVDDEPRIVKTLVRQLSEVNIHIYTAMNGDEAIQILQNVTIDILITDYRMPGMNGLELVYYFRKQSPDTLAILISGFYDYNMLIESINKGQIFYFLHKPWDAKEIFDAVNKCIERKEREDLQRKIEKAYLINKDRWLELFENTQVSTQKLEKNTAAFKKIIEVKDKNLYLHSLRVAALSKGFAAFLGLESQRINDITIAGTFHDLGKIVIRDQILYKEGRLEEKEYEEMKRHPSVGAEVLREIEAMEQIALIVEQHHERIDGRGYPKGIGSNGLLYESQIVSLADAFDALVSDRIYRRGVEKERALRMLVEGKAGTFSVELIAQFKEYQQV